MFKILSMPTFLEPECLSNEESPAPIDWAKVKSDFLNTFQYSGGILRYAKNGNINTATAEQIKAASLEDVFDFFRSEIDPNDDLSK